MEDHVNLSLLQWLELLALLTFSPELSTPQESVSVSDLATFPETSLQLTVKPVDSLAWQPIPRFLAGRDVRVVTGSPSRWNGVSMMSSLVVMRDGPLPTHCSTSIQASGTYTITVCPPDTNVGPGTVDVPINVSNPQGIDAFGFKCYYYPDSAIDSVHYMEVIPSTLTQDWIALGGQENQPGVITVGGFHTEPIQESNPSPICFMRISIALRQGEQQGSVSLCLRDFVDDLAEAEECCGTILVATVPILPTTWGRVKLAYR